MIQQQIDYLTNSTAISGANIPDGIRQGNVYLAGLPNHGVPTGLVHSYNCGLKASVTLGTVTIPIGGQNITHNVPLAANVVAGSTQLTNLQDNVTALQLDAPRALAISTSVAATITINVSGFDRFYNPISFSRSATFDSTDILTIDVGIYLITNIEIIVTSVVAASTVVTVQTSAFAELLFTDYGFSGNFINAISGSSLVTPLSIATVAVTVPQDLNIFVSYPYIPANWNGLVTYTAGRPRPLVSLNPGASTPSDAILASDKSQIVTQMVYGFNDTQYSLNSFLNTPVPLTTVFTDGVYPGDDVPVFTPSVQSVFGRTNNTINWKGWVA